MVGEAGKQRSESRASNRSKAVQHSEIDADSVHRTPAVEVASRIYRGFNNAQRSGGQCAGRGRRSDNTAVTAVADPAVGREMAGGKGRRGRDACLSFAGVLLFPARAPDARWPELTWIMAIVAGGSATARGGERWAFRQHASPATSGAPFGVGLSPERRPSRGVKARVMRAPDLHSGGPDRRHDDEIRQRDQLPYRV